MVGGLGKPFYVNVPNRGAVTNMADDAFLEMLCDVDMEGPRPRPVGDKPTGLRGWQRRVLDAHELTAEAMMPNSSLPGIWLVPSAEKRMNTQPLLQRSVT